LSQTTTAAATPRPTNTAVFVPEDQFLNEVLSTVDMMLLPAWTTGRCLHPGPNRRE